MKTNCSKIIVSLSKEAEQAEARYKKGNPNRYLYGYADGLRRAIRLLEEVKGENP